MSALRGILNPLNVGGETVEDLTAFTREVFVNEFPLVSRVETREVGDTVFKIISYEPRPRYYTLGAAVASAGSTTITVDDVSPFMPGDVLEIGAERVEVKVVDVAQNQVTVLRGAEGTTAATHANGDAATLIGNSRFGDEVDQEAHRAPRDIAEQYVQTWQFPVQVGGLANAVKNVRLPSGDSDLFTSEQKRMMIEMVRDKEFSSYYGKGKAPSFTERAKQKGLKALIDPANVTTNPVNSAAYHPEDLIRDVVQTAVDGGGEPDVLLVSSNFLTGFAIWGHGAQRIQAGGNTFGTPIKVLAAPFLADIQIIPSLQLKPFTCAALTSREVYWGQVRGDAFKPRGSRGDAVEGDWLSSGAIGLENPRHHAWVEGITGFAKG